MKKIGIIDIGSGNVFAVQNALRRLDKDFSLVNLPSDVLECSHVILPGVGSFDDYIMRLQETGLFQVLADFHDSGNYLLGICIGMHVLADRSDEGLLNGLGLVPGEVKRLDSSLNLPHMGWNSVSSQNKIFDNIEARKGYYFLHNFHFVSSSPSYSIATTDYGEELTCIVNNKKVYGVQFHPEKSHLNGEKLFKNFLDLT